MTKTYAQLKAEIAELETKAALVRAKEIDDVVGRIREAITAYELTPDQLFGRAPVARGGAAKTRTKPSAAAARPPKFKDPVSGKTWTGMGKPPGWIAGKDRDGFLIDGPGVAAHDPKPVRAAKAAAKGTAKSKVVNGGS